MTPRKILVPLDDGPFSRQILPAVCQVFAPSRSTTLILLRVAEPPAVPPALPLPVVPSDLSDGPGVTFPLYVSLLPPEPAVSRALDDEIERVRAYLERDLRDAGRCLSGFAVRVAVRFGEPAAEIIRFVEEEHVDLVAMATHARVPVTQLVLGSVARDVLQHVSVAVLLLRPAEQNTAHAVTPSAPTMAER